MTKTSTFKFVLATLFVAMSLWVAPTLAIYPERQVTIVVPYPPGGVTDVYGRALAQRHPAAMEVPTFRELGIDLVFGSWFGFFVPTGTFGDIQNTIIAGIELALKDPTVISAIEKTGLRYTNLKQQDYQKFLDAEEARLRRLIKTEGASIQLE